MISKKFFQLCRRWRKADQVEVNAAEQGCSLRRHCRHNSFLFQLGEDEGINRTARPISVFRVCWRMGPGRIRFSKNSIPWDEGSSARTESVVTANKSTAHTPPEIIHLVDCFIA